MWYLVVIIAASSFVILFILHQRVIDANDRLTVYHQSPVCSNSDPCKQILQVIVKSSKIKIIKRSVRSYVPKGPDISLPTLAENYVIDVIFPDKRIYSAIIMPNAPTNTEYFDPKDVYLPTSGDLFFLENNFPDGKEIKVEAWKGQITFVSTSIREAQNFLLEQDPAREISVPTVNHPQVILSLAQRDANNVFIGSLIVLTLTILIAIRLSKFSFSRR